MSAVAQKIDPKPEYEGVYYIPVDDEYELSIARRWFEERHGDMNRATGWPKLADHIPLPRLVKGAIVVPIIRGEDRSPAVKYFRDINGASHTERVPLTELAKEMRECARVRVADHWNQSTSEWDAFGGELQRPKFLEALGISCVPARPRIHVGKIDELRLSFF